MEYPPLMIEACGLVKTYGPTPALTGLDLSVPSGTATCLVGPNGAGKTTAVRILATLVRPDAGWARVAGHEVVADGAEVRRNIGLTGQYASVDQCLSGRANLQMIGELSRLSRRETARRATALLAQFGLEEAAGRPVRSYSGGMRRRLDLAASLLGRPRVLFLDEPTTGLDPASRRVLWESIRALVRDGTTLLLTTQYLEEADQLADRICVVNGGRVVAEGTPADLKAGIGAPHLRLTVPPGSLSRAASVLSTHVGGAVRSRAADSCLEVPVARRPGLVTDVVRALADAGISVSDLSLREPSLDDVFHDLTSQPSSHGEGSWPQTRSAAPPRASLIGAGAARPGAGRRIRSVIRARANGLRQGVADVRILAWRTLARIIRTPEQLLNVTVQPLVFVLLFSYVFNGAIILPGPGDYRDYLIAGIFAVNMGGTAQGAAIGLAVDLADGLIDRFRSLPMNRAMVLAGRTVADLVMTVIAAVVTAASGLIVGWRIHAGPTDTLLAIGIAVLFAYAAAWTGACVGLLARGAESAQAVGLTVLVPLSLTSNAFISTDRLTPWLRDVANWNPISVLAAACRQLLGNPNPAAAVRSWPMQHPAAASALWSSGLIAVMVPLAVYLYARRAQR